MPLPTLKRIREAYATVGLRPTRQVFATEESCCPLTACALSRYQGGERANALAFYSGASDDDACLLLAVFYGVTCGAAKEFMSGVDGHGSNAASPDEAAAYRAGMEVGIALFGDVN